MSELREVSVVVGKRSYRMRTALDEDTLARVTSMAAVLCEAAGEGIDQENRLLLTCLQLAYSLDRISERVGPLLSHMETLTPFEPEDPAEEPEKAR